EAGRVVTRAVRVAAKYAEGLKISRCTFGLDRIARAINGRIQLSGVAVFDAGEKPEDALARQRRQDVADKRLADHVTLFVDQDEEERLIFDDRPAQSRAELVAVLVIFLNTIEVVEPFAGVERRIAVRPKRAAAKLVGSRPR